MNLKDEKEKLFNYIEEAEEEHLMMSVMNCHVIGVDSIVLKKNEDGSLFRVFLCHPNASLFENRLNGNYPIGFHNHKYDLTLSLSFGNVTNLIIKEFPDEPLSSIRVDKYSFTSQIENASSFDVKREEGSWYVKIIKELKLVCDTPFFLGHNVFHTIHVPYGERAAWYVQEGKKQKSSTALYKKYGTNISRYNLYKKFDDIQHLKNTVELFFNGDLSVPF